MRLEERVDAADLRTLGTFDPQEMVADLDQITETPSVTLLDLYHRWERQNWSAYALDFTQDAADWSSMGDELTERLMWVMSMFFHGEECVTATLAPWVNSAPTPEMRIFLSTQLADEARHTVFFDRFFAEAVGATGPLEEKLDWCHPRVNAGFDKLFYDMLPAIAAEVNAAPGDPVTFARGIAMYHMLLEGTLAVPGQKYILAFCRDRGVLPAFRAGFTAVARDESRHVGAGVRILQQLIAMDADCVPAVQELIQDSFPYASQVFQPPGGDFTYMTVLGYDLSELFRFGLFSLDKRLRAAGIPMPRQKPTRLPYLTDDPVIPDRPLTPVQEMLRPMRDQITPELVFQGLPMVFNPQAAGDTRAAYEFNVTGEGGGVWTIRIADGTCEVLEGPAPGGADWRLELDRDTWVAMSVGDLIGAEAFLLGRVTLEGDAVAGSNFDRMFVPPAQETVST